MTIITALAPLYPELYLCGFSLLSLMLGVFCWPKIDLKFLGIITVILLGTIVLTADTGAGRAALLGGMFVHTGFTQFAKIILLIAALLVTFISSKWLLEQGGKSFEFLTLLLLATLGLMLMVSAGDLLALYVALELASLSLYVMAAFDRDNGRSSEAGLKYFVLGALASGILLFGISLVYGFTGTTSFAGLTHYFAATSAEAGGVLSPAVVVGMVLIVIAFCFKISAVPFHMWTPDVYEGAPTPVTAFFAVVPKIAAIAVFVRILQEPFGDLLFQWQQLVIFAAIASMFLGAFGAMRQTNIKRLLAYSSIGHVGFMLMGLATGTTTGAASVLIYLSLYLFMSVGAFGCVLALNKGKESVESLNDFAGLAKTQPLIAGLLTIFIFSMAGIPPLAGFFGKMVVVLAAITHGLVWLAVLGLIASVVAAYYYLKLVKVMYFDAPTAQLTVQANLLQKSAIALAALVTIGYIAYPAPLIDHATFAAEQLLR